MIPGQKVRLRAYREDDLKNAFAMINNQAVTRFLQFMRPRSQAEERAWIERVMRNEDPTSVALAIESKDNEYLGSVGLMHIDLRNRAAELGISIGIPGDWGKGMGSEAALLMMRHGFEEMGLHRIYLRVFDYNERALRSYKKLGFTEEGRMRQAHFRHGHWHDVIWMGILVDEFFEKHGRTSDGKVTDD